MIRPIIFVALLLATVGCSSKKNPPLVSNLQVQANPQAPHVVKDRDFPQPVVAELTFSKRAFANQEWLYGVSIQKARFANGGEDAEMPAINFSWRPTQFQVVNSQLQLLEDRTHLAESDINFPSRLLHSLPVVRNEGDQLTVRIEQASPVLQVFMMGNDAPAPRASWVRSAKFVAENNLLMMETSVEFADGSLAEFLEVLYPRSAFVPKDAQPLFSSADLEDLAGRFRFLGSTKIWRNIEGKGRIQAEAAERFHFDPKSSEPIQWWVSRNVDERYIQDISNGLEAWNRYSQSHWGKDIVKFAGKLPEGVVIGDPRYNVIVWDNVGEAGAAYESQASDPITGIQSHSLIYLPYSWINYGRDFWKNAEHAERETNTRVARAKKILKKLRFAGRPATTRCLENPANLVSITARENPEEFGRGLLKAVAFHEVGHALGLAHNFKGSLSLDPDAENPVFSSSIMDYNQLNVERGSFFRLDTWDGPLLEYDRQILSALYNGGKDIKGSDPIVPACNDEEADDREGGVDPLCVRYDVGRDPSVRFLRGIDLITNPEAKAGTTESLSKAIRRIARTLTDGSDISTKEKADEALQTLVAQIKGTSSIYISSSASSLAYIGSQAVLMAYVVRGGALADGWNESEMRNRVVEGLMKMSAWEAIPVEADLEALAKSAQAWLLTTPYFETLDTQAKADLAAEWTKAILGTKSAMEDSQLPRARARIISALQWFPKAPFHFSRSDASTVDLEKIALDLLEKGLTTPVKGKARPSSERTSYAQTLVGFPEDVGGAAKGRVRLKLDEEILASSDASKRAELRKLKALLK